MTESPCPLLLPNGDTLFWNPSGTLVGTLLYRSVRPATALERLAWMRSSVRERARQRWNKKRRRR